MSNIIISLDNTISDDSWRIEVINWEMEKAFQQYHRYQLLAGFDSIHNDKLFRNTGMDIIVLSSRPLFYGPITMEWLRKHHVDARYILLNADSDRSSEPFELKGVMLKQLNKQYGIKSTAIVHAYDSDPKVVRMYIREGITSTCIRIHDVSHEKPEEAS